MALSLKPCTTKESIYFDHKKKEGRQNSQEWDQNELHNFQKLITNLDKGSCAKIDVVQHISTGFMSVLKVFKETKSLHAEQELGIFAQTINSPFLLHCYDSFAGFGLGIPKSLLLQYAPFGNLDKLTRSLKGLGSSSLRLYAKEVALAMDFLHSHQIMHRDIKPENILILSSGHVVLADFNLAFKKSANLFNTNRMCGTHFTRPPEVWEAKMYDESVDVWMYGISLFNIASNMWPFGHVFIDKQIQAINYTRPQFPQQFFSDALVDLIEQTLQVESCDRIPAEFITHHPYFRDLNDHEVPFSPSYLLSLVSSAKEKDIIECILQHEASSQSPQPSTSSLDSDNKPT